jgi:hypothetical protein
MGMLLDSSAQLVRIVALRHIRKYITNKDISIQTLMALPQSPLTRNSALAPNQGEAGSPQGAQRIPGKTVVGPVPIPGLRCASSGLRTIVISTFSVKVVP